VLGAIARDVIGSVYESGRMKSTDFPLFSRQSTFTYDTVLMVAVADHILHGKEYASTNLFIDSFSLSPLDRRFAA